MARRNYDLFDKVLDIIYSSDKDLEITFTPENVAEGDRFLIFSAYKQIKCTFKRSGGGLLWVLFDCDEPILLEDCPDSFYESIIKNAK